MLYQTMGISLEIVFEVAYFFLQKGHDSAYFKLWPLRINHTAIEKPMFTSYQVRVL